MSGWFAVPLRLRGTYFWLARFECGHHGTFYSRPMIEHQLRYGCPRCGWKYVTGLCRVPES